MSTLRLLQVFWIAVSILSFLPAQSLEHSITLDDGDALSPDEGFGIVMAPDGIHAYAAIAGRLFGPNNDNIAHLDVIAGSQVGLAQTQLFPEDPTVTLDATGAIRHVYVTNSTTGSVSCFTPGLVPVATIPLANGCLTFTTSSFPFALLVSPDQSRVYVTMLDGCGRIDVIDSDPASPTFNTVISSFFVPNAQGRPSWWTYPLMVVPTVTPELVLPPSFPNHTRAGFAVVSVSNRVTQASYLVTPVIPGNYTYTTECVVTPGGTVLLSVGNDVTPTVYECSISSGSVLRTLDLTNVTDTSLHGLATNADQTIGVVTSLHGDDSVFFDLASFTLIGVHDHGPGTQPNDVVFTPDGSRAVVSLQGVARVDVLKDIPGYVLSLAAPSSATVGGPLTYVTDNCESGQPCAIFASLAGAGPQQVGPYTVYLSNPIVQVHGALGDLQGGNVVTFTVPNVPGLPGMTVSAQAVTVDRDGTIRLSNGVQTLIN